MQHIKGCCCYFRQGRFYPLCPLTVSLSLAFSRLLFVQALTLEQAGTGKEDLLLPDQVICTASKHLTHIHRHHFICPCTVYLLIYFAACTFLCWGAYVSVKFLLCVIKCVYANVFCAIVELLLGLSQDYYSVSALLLPFISIFSPSFIQLFIQQSS